jgi:hypothetical protein
MVRARSCLPAMLIFAMLAGQAYGGPFTLDKYDAMLLRQVSVSAPDKGSLAAVTDVPATYGETMQGTVGYVGWLWDMDADQYASMKIGAAGTAALGPIEAAGSYSSFQLFFANDNDDPWSVRLYVDAGSTSYASSYTALASGAHATLALDFGTTLDFSQVTDLGFEIQGHFVPGQKPSNPDYYHISTAAVPVPVPGAFGLTLVGLGVGLRWRRQVR